ncbi:MULTISPECIES: hypothetical protein [unclassified Streptomyces]|uniref:hypothetical protein n=1 Tax=unclassified Streptomyces TaxID=2593676 RepID=UPI0015EB2EB8|nr:hypothetical protein [Streptomyces sp. KhCrAH-43]
MAGLVAAVDGWVVQVTAQPGTDTAGIPGGGAVVGWVLVADEAAAGGARVEPVFVSAGRAWTPDQYRATYGRQLGVVVGRGR